MRFWTFIILGFLLTSCGDDVKLPTGFEMISSDQNSIFVYIAPSQIGNKTGQREAGKIICEELFKITDYCDVYFWQKRDEVPLKFPIINRKSIIGLFQMRNGKVKLKALTEISEKDIPEDSNNTR